MNKLILVASTMLDNNARSTILRRLMRFSTRVDFPREKRERNANEKNSLVPLSIIERRVFG